jgi:hypothetical protein
LPSGETITLCGRVTEDEIDLESGFLMVPQAVPVQPPLSVTTVGEPPGIGGSSGSPTPLPGSPGAVAGPAISSPSSGGATAQKTVEISFSADRNQLFAAWNAIANLADLAGKVREYALRDFTVAIVASLLKDNVGMHKLNRDTVTKIRSILSGFSAMQ